jgi:Phage protein (N4 Gp49/phage Sf6 gene 66) family
MPHSSLEVTDKESAAIAKAPRVSLASMEAKIAHKYEFTADKIVDETDYPPVLRILSVCVLVMRNGFTVIGKAAPASADNFNRDLGKKLAYEDAIRQLWPLEGYALREKLAA